jgi:hypothetical protein
VANIPLVIGTVAVDSVRTSENNAKINTALNDSWFTFNIFNVMTIKK